MRESQGQTESRFLVPQYIDTESKIFGPVTVRQFAIMLISAILGFAIWKIFENGNQILGAALILLQFMIFFIFAFAVINGQKFHYFFLNLIMTLKRPKLRVYRREFLVSTSIIPDEREERINYEKKLPPKSRLSDISLLVDTGGAYNIDDSQFQNSSTDIKEMNI